ncbi:winged helix-turn-helix domain-containing protein [Defluviimonas sp. D31]|uniref:winged helix-turn-helix domain-containing protein n=1 Tax=Defluviimonas sp. D31 TaxID=3083253 RepID=UPI00296F1EFC|nr:winged helix-turn-helix domain-containing protein [Defluviimonas sp. D31]MDW4551620.1 winged helix-turn-helix domain-containing protein [Defluviimonas sp. D31]
MPATSLAYEHSNSGQAPAVQIDVGSFIALMSMVAKHVDITSFQGQTAAAAAPTEGRVTKLKRASAGDRKHLRSVVTSTEDSLGAPDVSLVSMLIDALAPTTGAADAVPLKASETERIYPFGKTWLHVDAAKLVDSEGAEVPLTAMEFRLLKLLAENRGRVLNRDQILEGAHDRSWEPFDRSIDIRISRIRKKIERNPQKPEAIRTVRGIGYIYDPA